MNVGQRQQPHTLAELIQGHMAITGDSLSAIARRGGMPRQTVQAIVNRPMKAAPHQDTLTKLAKGLQMSEATVRAVAMRNAVQDAYDSHLHVIDSDPTLMVLVDTCADLTPAERKVVLATAEAMRQATKATGTNNDTHARG